MALVHLLVQVITSSLRLYGTLYGTVRLAADEVYVRYGLSIETDRPYNPYIPLTSAPLTSARHVDE
jgi:hypothetical protein